MKVNRRLILNILGFIRKIYLVFESNMLYYITKMLKLDSYANIFYLDDIKINKDTVFIMGSGYSINDISDEEWRHIRDIGDILAFNLFYKGKFIPIDYHIVREMGRIRFFTVLLNGETFKSYCDEMFSNPYYKETKYFILYDKKAPATVLSVFFMKLFKNKYICFYKNLKNRTLILKPSEDINTIPHCGATLFDAINISYLLGYKNIVLVGVDLYDRRYFWLRKNETREGDLKRGATCNDIHNTANFVLEAMPIWKEYLQKRGVKLYVYNPRSLLNKILPIYKLDL